MDVDNDYVTKDVDISIGYRKPEKSKIRVWGSSIDTIRSITSKIKVSEINTYDSDHSIGYTMPWIDFIAIDVDLDILNQVDYISHFKIDSIKYEIPQHIIDKYTAKMDELAVELAKWIEYKTNVTEYFDEQVLSIEEIETQRIQYSEELKRDIEDSIDKTPSIKTNNKNKIIKDDTTVSSIERVEVSSHALYSNPPIHYVTIFYDNKSVETVREYPKEILKLYESYMDDETRKYFKKTK